MAALSQLVGQVLGHCRIIEQIGAGGMGIVYRAHDEQLDRDVAVKVLPAGMLADDTTRKRFRKEALSLAKLNHPNIATVHEFGSQDGTDFLVTEYIAGMTLDGKLAAGALPAKQAIDLGVQLAQGLSAAHEHGIVHRDLKPANLRLTPDDRLKILDFGLAQLIPHGSELGQTATLTKSQEVSGTLPYMSPEQLRGGLADARTDIWAAGAVLYEMASAHRPFEEKVPTALAGDIIHKTPPPPRKLRPELSPKLEAVILKCLEKEPAERYQSARELQSDLERLSMGVTPLVGRRHWLWPGLASTIALLLGATASWYLVSHRKGTESSSFRARRSVAVLGFKNISGKPDEAWISTALSEMLAAELAAGEHLRTIPGENVARTKLDLSLPDTDSYGRDTLARIRKNLGTDYVVLGSYFDTGKEAGGQVRLNLWLQDARAGETIAAVSETGTEAQLLDLVSRTGSELRGKLGVGEVTVADIGAVRASMPSDPETARLYAEGLKKLRAFDALGARDLLEKTAASEPGFPLAHSALAEVWSRLGYDVKAKEEARKAFDLSANLSREDRLSVEAHYREANRERDKAIELYRALFKSFPDNLDYGLLLASAQWHSGKGKDALVTVEALRQMSLSAREDPRIDLAEAYSAESLGDFKRAQAAAAGAGKRGEALGAPLLVAAAQLEQCRIFRNRGQYQEARTACGSAKDAYANTGDREQMAVALLAVGATLYEQGDLEGAQKAEEEALAVFRQVGHESGIASTLSELANVLSVRGDHVGAESRYEQALATYRKINSKANIGTELHNVASELKLEGKLDDARAKFHEALVVNRELGQEDVEAMDLANLGAALCLRGDLAESARTLDHSLEICRRIDFKQACGVALSSQGDLLSWEGKLDQARDKYEEALALRKEMGAAIDVAESQVSIAELSIEAEHSRDTAAAVREAMEVFRKQKLIEDEIWANAVLARALLAQGKSADAGKELDVAMGRGAKIQNEEARLKLALTAASIRAASGRRADQAGASNSLEAVLAQAKKHGFVGYQLEARLALGEIEMKSGHIAAGRARLTALENDARAKGFLLIARKAAAVSKGSAGNQPQHLRTLTRLSKVARLLS
jgi:serine/threonine protein kinase/tetratricopeptide (TPR) repeat protein